MHARVPPFAVTVAGSFDDNDLLAFAVALLAVVEANGGTARLLADELS